jgi:hypothetical protein
VTERVEKALDLLGEEASFLQRFQRLMSFENFLEVKETHRGTQDFLPSLQAKQAVFLVPLGKDQPCPLRTRWIPVDLPVEPCSYSQRPRRGGSGFVEASEAG